LLQFHLKACSKCGGDLALDQGDWCCLQCGTYYYTRLYRRLRLPERPVRIDVGQVPPERPEAAEQEPSHVEPGHIEPGQKEWRLPQVPLVEPVFSAGAMADLRLAPASAQHTPSIRLWPQAGTGWVQPDNRWL